MTDTTTALAKLREPFAAHHISKLPKPTKAQTEAVKADFKAGIRCTICGAWHHPKVEHLDYVGHAALTDRLLDTDPAWSWEPAALTPDGLPAFDRTGGLWIKLTVCGVTRLGYGAADGKQGGDAVKEIIGDALRNAGMRFGAALDLWHKGDLHAGDDSEANPRHDPTPKTDAPAVLSKDQRRQLMMLGTAKKADTRDLCKHVGAVSIPEMLASKFDAAIAWLNALPDTPASNPQSSEMLSDEIPY